MYVFIVSLDIGFHFVYKYDKYELASFAWELARKTYADTSRWYCTHDASCRAVLIYMYMSLVFVVVSLCFAFMFWSMCARAVTPLALAPHVLFTHLAVGTENKKLTHSY